MGFGEGRQHRQQRRAVVFNQRRRADETADGGGRRSFGGDRTHDGTYRARKRSPVEKQSRLEHDEEMGSAFEGVSALAAARLLNLRGLSEYPECRGISISRRIPRFTPRRARPWKWCGASAFTSARTNGCSRRR